YAHQAALVAVQDRLLQLRRHRRVAVPGGDLPPPPEGNGRADASPLDVLDGDGRRPREDLLGDELGIDLDAAVPGLRPALPSLFAEPQVEDHTVHSILLGLLFGGLLRRTALDVAPGHLHGTVVGGGAAGKYLQALPDARVPDGPLLRLEAQRLGIPLPPGLEASSGAVAAFLAPDLLLELPGGELPGRVQPNRFGALIGNPGDLPGLRPGNLPAVEGGLDRGKLLQALGEEEELVRPVGLREVLLRPDRDALDWAVELPL